MLIVGAPERSEVAPPLPACLLARRVRVIDSMLVQRSRDPNLYFRDTASPGKRAFVSNPKRLVVDLSDGGD